MFYFLPHSFAHLMLQTVPYYFVLNHALPGHLGGSVVEHLPSAEGMIWGPGIESHTGLPARSLLLSLPMSLPLFPCLS